MQTEHRIDELIVDLSFNTTRLARHETALLSEWLSEDLLPALDKVFSHYSPGTQILRFETLEFDCGNLTSRHYQQAIREQLLKQFAQLLESQLLAVAPENRQLGISTAQGDTPNAELALKQLFSYLATGQLSAHHPAVQPQSSANKNKHAQSPGLHAQLLDAVIAQHNIADLLRELPQRDLLIQRLLTQFTLLQRMELLRQLAPQHVQNVIALFDLLQLLENNYRIHLSHAKDQSINYGSTIEPSTNEDSTFKGLTFEGSITERLITGHQPINYDSLGSDAVQQTVWETLLELALAQPQATAQFWINQILHKLASKFAFSINQLQQDLVAIKLPASAAAQALENLQAIIAQTMADRNVAEAKENSVKIRPDNLLQQASDNQYSFETIKPQSLNAESPIDAEQQSVAQLQQLVAAALIRADANQLQQLWPQLLANEQLLLAALQHYLPQAEIRQQLMLRLPITLLAGIITLLAPALNDIFYRLQQCASQLNDFIAAQLKSFTSSVASSENSNQNENAEAQQSAELVARQLWEITLGLLFNGTTVNSHYQGDPEVFLNALALRYAELHNLEEQPLQQLLRQLVFGQQQDEASNNRFISSQNAERLHNASAGIGPTVDLQQDQQEIQKNQELEKARELLINQEQQSNYPVSNATLGIADVALDTTGSTGETVRLNSDITRLTADTSRLNANNLVSVSDHQLFDLCLRLKSGALVWSSLAADVALLQRLISSYIRLGHSATAENCADFVAAIDAQAESSPAPAVFYLTVLQTLIADKLIDLELIAQTVQRNSKSQQIDVEIPSLVAQEAELKQGMNLLPDLRLPQKPMELEAFADTTIKSQQALVASSLNNLTQEVAQTKRVPAELNESSVHTAEIPEAGTSAIKPNIEAITQELLRDTQPLLRLQHLQLNTIQWQELTFELLKRSSVADVNASTDLIAAIEIQARGLLNPTLYYRRIIQALLQQQPIDLEVFADTNIDSQRNDVADSGINNLTQEVAYDKQVPAELNESSSQTVEIPAAATSAVKPDIEAITQELLRDTQPSLRLQQLQLNTTRWQELTFELLKHSSVLNVITNADLIAAIEKQGRGLLNPALYYRRIIRAILQRKPIDLEAFAVESIENPANASTQTSGRDLPLPVHTVEQMPRNSSVQSQDQNDIASTYTIAATDPIASIVKILTTDTRPLLHLQQLQLDATQWQELACELIKHNAVINFTDVVDVTDVGSNTELIAAIKSQARSALNPIIYYRRIIQAVLQQQSIDLEAFSATNADQQYTSTNSSVNNLTQDVTIATHADHPEYFTSESPGSKNLYPEQAIDYSLSTGTDTSVRKPALSLAQLFAANQPLTQEQLLTLQQHVNLLLNHPNPTLVAEWSQLLAPANNAQLLIQLVPSHLLHQIMLRLQPARYAALDAVVKVVLEALALLVNDLNNPAIKQVRWEFIIRYLLTTNDNQIATASNESAQTLSIELCKHLAPAAGIDDLQRLVNLTQRRIVLLKPAAQLKPAMRLQEINTNSATQSDENTPQWESGLHIDNAGAVLAGAFLPRLFSMLNLIQDGKFIHPGAADRAVHLVQFMVTGASSTPEYDLILNKILCGISTSIPVSAGIEITEQEQTLIEQMLTSMIQHWKVLGSTSISGLRETFFQRQGWLILEEDCWRLKVKEQTFDLLLDRLPWSISLIKHGWMDKPLRVSWRNHS